MHTVYICAGSNIGKKRRNCEKGITTLETGGAAAVLQWSGFYKTEPVDFEDQDWFVNVVAKVSTALGPVPLLDAMKKIETDSGRTGGTVRFGPRILDLDILLYDDLVMDSPKLSIPHPRMHQRRFVLKPFCDIDPEARHPVFKKSMARLLEDLGEQGQRVVPYK